MLIVSKIISIFHGAMKTEEYKGLVYEKHVFATDLRELMGQRLKSIGRHLAAENADRSADQT